jgi:superfamily II DNA/RNA helicase
MTEKKTTFEDLGLSEELLSAIADCGYTHPTPIQEQAIPVVLMARDVVGLAQTGTGKTAGFTLPMIDILAGGRAKARMPRSLILSPTRELAAQIAENFDTYGKNHKLSKALLVGGTSMGDQIKILERGADVLIATPGRLLDLFERGQILLNDIKILVIDEADRMLDMGFIPDIEKIVSLVPFTRQTLLFSATMAPEIKKLTAQFLSNPKEVSVAPPASPAATVEQFVVRTDRNRKNADLLQVIKNEDVKNAFVFCNRKRDIGGVEKFLKTKGYRAAAMHGDMAQTERTNVLKAFKGGDVDLLICSDVAARGIDVSNTSHVLNYDVPMNADDYVHRIGRTGRAGQKGRAWMFVMGSDAKFMDAIEKKIGSTIQEKTLDSSGATRDSKPASKSSASPDSSSSFSSSSGKKPNSADKSEQKSKPSQSENKAKPSQNKPVQKSAQNPSVPDHKAGKKSDDGGSGVVGFGSDMPSFF